MNLTHNIRAGLYGILALFFAQDTPNPTDSQKEKTSAVFSAPFAQVCGDPSLDSLAKALFAQQAVYDHLYPQKPYEQGGVIRQNGNCLEIIELEDPLKLEISALKEMAQANNPEVFGKVAYYTNMRYKTLQKASSVGDPDNSGLLTEKFTKASINYSSLAQNDPTLFKELSSGPVSIKEKESFEWFSALHASGMSYQQIQEKNKVRSKEAQAYLIKTTFIEAEATIDFLLNASYTFNNDVLNQPGVVAYWHTHNENGKPYSKPDIYFSQLYGPLFTLYPADEGYIHLYLNKEGHLKDVTCLSCNSLTNSKNSVQK